MGADARERLVRGTGSSSPADPGRRVLIVEDDRRLRAALVEVFARRGLIALVLRDGGAVIRELVHSMEESLARFRRFDLVVADVAAPCLGGLEILAAVRARRWPVEVVLSAQSPLPALQATVRDLGGAGLIRRPSTPEEWDEALQILSMPVTQPRDHRRRAGGTPGRRGGVDRG
jgi:two-component system OmpR family response regulator